MFTIKPATIPAPSTGRRGGAFSATVTAAPAGSMFHVPANDPNIAGGVNADGTPNAPALDAAARAMRSTAYYPARRNGNIVRTAVTDANDPDGAGIRVWIIAADADTRAKWADEDAKK